MNHPKHTNRLIHETSPYLLQHAHNPVNWFPWGPEAIAEARANNKPIFLSIGYSACHWCHVMEHESFENEEVAQVLNDLFVPVKVDREERPDLDEIYMNATILFTRGQGGWPMSVWLTPDGRPFFAGTYFPPDDYYGRPGFKNVLLRVAGLWKERSQEIAMDASRVTDALQQMHSPMQSGIATRDSVSMAAWQMTRVYDPKHGGVSSGSNKFPPSMSMSLLLREYRKTRNHEFLAPVELTLTKMGQGGIHDQLGGGIHRYSTDPLWHVPHFEKMLYDQALVSSIYLEGFQITGREDFAEAAKGIYDYVLRCLRSEEDGFFSAEDADSEGMEGKFYLWTLDEIQQSLGEDEARLFAAHFDISSAGNWDHPGDAHVPAGPKNILRVLRPLNETAQQLEIASEELQQRLQAARAKMFMVREARVKPALDDKILAAWNGLMISSLAAGSAVLNERKYFDAASQAARFLLNRMMNDGRLLRSYRSGKAHLTAYVDDYAFMIDGLITLFEVSGDISWLNESERLLEIAIRFYWDDQDGGFFFTASDHEKLILRSKLAGDSAIPSGNSVMIGNLLRMAQLLGKHDYRDKAGAILSLFSGNATQSPFGHERFLSGLETWHEGYKEIAIVGPLDDPRTQELRQVVYRQHLPNRLVVLLDPSNSSADTIISRVPLLAGKQMISSKPAAYVCRNYACQQPVTDPLDLSRQLTGDH
ncbi:MAG: hypothetical protein A3F68_09005 [Acidobacteria bacterium RIFCSPLOWO2_12_FULL_54_10]|nr:MAG: hypothetical protein A3F68_09005 [Acidobacteria bacterium RIFCSPLOWO2_12_FULL_54_10]